MRAHVWVGGALALVVVSCQRSAVPVPEHARSNTEALAAGHASFRALPAHNGTVMLPWMNGEPQVMKDRLAGSAAELFGFGWSDKLYLYKSADLGQSWAFVDPNAGESIGTYRLMGATQDSLGKVHMLFTDGAAGQVKYARVALDRTGGSITGFHSEVKNVVVPGAYNTNNDVRGYAVAVPDQSGTETLVFCVTDNPNGSTHFRIQLARAPLTAAVTADFTKLDGTAGVTVAINSGALNNHDHGALFAQLGATKDLWLFWGPIDAEYAPPDSTFMTRLKLAASGPHTWALTTAIAMTGSDTHSSPELLSVVGTQNYVWMLWLNPATGMTLDRVDATGAYATNIVPNPDGIPHRNGWGTLSVADDETRLWVVYNLLTTSDQQLVTRQAFWDGQGWTQYNDSAPFLGDSWGFATTTGWNEGVVAVRLDGNTQGITLATIYGGDNLATPVAPAITSQPSSVTLTAGQSATFSVKVTGTPAPTYQWLENGAPISGAVAASFATGATTVADDGSTFSVVVTNTAGSVTSTAAVLTVQPANVAPSISAQPVAVTVTEGQTAMFSVSASGYPAPTYQWRRNAVAISGATSAAYALTAALADSGAVFSVVVSNVAGSVTSADAALTVQQVPVAPVITTQPVAATVMATQTATFTVVATGTPAPAYQWRRGGTDIAGATSATYAFTAALTDDAAVFSVAVTSSAGSVISSDATLTVNPFTAMPVITAQPQSAVVDEGLAATFSVAATGTPAPAYQWRVNGLDILGATGPSYTTPPASAGDSGSVFTVVVSNSAGTVTSAGATLAVNVIIYLPPSISVQPQPATVTEGQTATFSVTASGLPLPTYQWRVNGTDIPGANAATFTTPVTTVGDNGGVYSVAVTNALGQLVSSDAVLTVNAIIYVPPTFSALPASVTVNEGQGASFSAAATGFPAPALQWRRNGADISGATGQSYALSSTVAADDQSAFTVVASNFAGAVESPPAVLTVIANLLPAFTTQPANVTVTQGQTATFTVAATGRPVPTLQWSKNGTPISGATAPSYTTPATSGADNGAHFAARATNLVGSVLSADGVLTVNVPATPASCNALHQSNPTAASGTYTIDPDGSGPNAAFAVYCDMTTNGGGWTVIYESGTTKKATTALNYTVLDSVLRTSASEVLLAYRDATLAPYAGGHTARFALPADWKAKPPFQYATSNLTVSVFIDAATTPSSHVLHYGYRDFDTDKCTDGWYAGGNEGRLCVENTTAPFYNGFASSLNDGCPDSTGGAQTRLCTASLRFSIAVR